MNDVYGSQMMLGTAPQSHDEIPTQIVPTQVETDTFTESTFDESEKDTPKLWARMVSISTAVPHKDVMLTPPDERKREGLVTLGRSMNCDYPFNHKRISNIHCLLYCQKSARGELQAYIEDNSANGTFVNRTRLNKSVRRLLHNGDEIALINPEYGMKPDGSLAKDVEAAMFYVHIFLPNATDRKVNTGGPFAFTNQAGSDPIRSGTVTNLLNQGRNITDYYEIRELLGSGAMGQVYRAIHRLDGHEVAVKATDMRECYFQQSLSQQEESGGKGPVPMTQSADKILKEAHMMRLLQHPKIIHMEDVFSQGTTLFMVMEMVHGGDLFERVVSKKRYDEDQARVVVLQLLSAIAYLHNRNVAHRDLKPENILLVSTDSDVDIKVTDFGLAKSADEAGGLKTYCGTPQYFAPEVLNQENKEALGVTYSLASDMWSVGVITYALLSGRLPWSDDDRARAREICSASYSLLGSVWSTVSPEAKAFISELIQVDPERRLTAERALYHDWFDPISHLRDRYAAEDAFPRRAEVDGANGVMGDDVSGSSVKPEINDDMELASAITIQSGQGPARSASRTETATTTATKITAVVTGGGCDTDAAMPPPSSAKLVPISANTLVAANGGDGSVTVVNGGAVNGDSSNIKKRRENPVIVEEDECADEDVDELGGPMEMANTVISATAHSSTSQDYLGVSPRKRVRAGRGSTANTAADQPTAVSGGGRRLRSSVAGDVTSPSSLAATTAANVSSRRPARKR